MLIMRRVRCLLSVAVAVVQAFLVMMVMFTSQATAGTVTMNACTRSQALSASWVSQSGPRYNTPLTEVDDCAAGGRMQIIGPKVSPVDQPGDYGQWSTVLPPAMALTSMTAPAQAALISPYSQNSQDTTGFHVRYMWGGGSVAPTDAGNCCGGLDYAAPVSQAIGG